MTDTSPKPIYIDVGKSLDVRLLGAGAASDEDWKREFIQRDAFDRLEAIVANRLEDAAKASVEAGGRGGVLDRRHGAITIHGTRGSGKTTFVLNAVARLCSQYHGLVNLGVLDPTLIGSKENLFLLILNRIKSEVEHAPKPRDQAWQDWEKSLEELAGGLCLLDGVGSSKHLTGDDWDDPHYAMDQGLEKAGAGQRLERNFHLMIQRSLAILKKDAFILALDDIDTNFAQGWEVLEILRRYLTSPRLIPILSGDMDLYSLLVRGRQWEQFPKQMLSYDKPIAATVGPMVSHLQSQYLLKILPPKYRIGLATFADVKDKVFVSLAGSGADKVEEFLRARLEQATGYRHRALDQAIALVFSQPVRTILNLLAVLGEAKTETVSRDLISLFTDVFTRLRTDSDECHRATVDGFPAFLATFLTRNRAWETAHALLPDLAEEDMNLASLAFAAKLGTYNCAGALDYMLRICQFREMAVHYRRDLLTDTATLERTADYLGLSRKGSLLEMSRHMVVLLRAGDPSNTKPVRSGTVAILALKSRLTSEIIKGLYGATPEQAVAAPPKEARQPPIRAFYDKIDRVIRNSKEGPFLGRWYNTPVSLDDHLSSEVDSALAALPFSRIFKKGERPTYASIHNILGAIAEIVQHPSRTRDILRNGSEIRAYRVPEEQLAGAPDASEDERDAERDRQAEEKTQDIDQHPLVLQTEIWAMGLKNIQPLPCYVMARVWARFFYTLGAIDDNISSDESYLGFIIHRQIIAFLNALLVEEVIYRAEYVHDLILRNPVLDDNVYMSNLRKISKKGDIRTPFAEKISHCPIFRYFVSPEVRTRTYIGGDQNYSHVIQYNVSGNAAAYFDGFYDLFNSIAVARPLPKGTRKKAEA